MPALREKLINKTESLDMRDMAKDVQPFLFSEKDVNRVLKFKSFAEQLKC